MPSKGEVLEHQQDDADIAHRDAFHHDTHAEYLLSNPLCDDSDWRSELLKGFYGVPGKASFVWARHFISSTSWRPRA